MFDSPTNLLDTCFHRSSSALLVHASLRAKGKLRDSTFSLDDDVVRGVTCKVRHIHRRFGGTCCLNLRGRTMKITLLV